MSVLVLKGHATRTEDLLAVLKSLGSLGGLSRVYPQYYYYVSNGKVMVTLGLIQGEWALFTLEKFEEKYPYKVGDKVMYKRELHFVKGMEWNGEEIRYKIDYGLGYSLTSIKVEELEPYKAKEETMEKNKHLELDKRYLRMARIWAENSYCTRRKVGALIVKDKMIISDGYNGTPSGFENVCELDNGTTKPYVLHAEANAITKIAKSGNNSDGATLYVTASPCLECSKLIIQSGIRRVVYSENYRLTDGIDLLKRAGVEVVFIELED